MERLTAERIAEIKARADAATAGPWEAEFPEGRDNAWHDIVVVATEETILNGETECRTEIVHPDYAHSHRQRLNQIRATMEFVAHSRADIPDLLAEIEVLQDELRAATSLEPKA